MSYIVVLFIGCIVLIGDAGTSTPNDLPTEDKRTDQGQQLPSREEILSMLDSMTGISDEEKENLRRDLQDGFPAEQHQKLPIGNDNSYMQQTFLLFSLLGFIALIFLFFTYKLYKSLSERERRRIEKKRMKEGKKKK